MAEHSVVDQAKRLLERIRKQEALVPTTPSTHEVGGVARISAELEGLLRCVLVDIAARQHRSADALLRAALGRRVGIRRANGGDLANAIRAATEDVGTQTAGVRIIAAELARPNNLILRTLQLRNAILHGRSDVATGRDAVRDLGAFIAEYVESIERS